MAEFTPKSMSPKTAIYIRVSTQFQVDKDSLQVQRRELVAYSQLVLNIQDYDIFEDPGYSGKNTDRPAYQMMMNRLRSGEFSHLLVWKIDRISRNLLDFATMYAELKKIGVTFVSKNEQFDTSTAIGEAMLKIILVFAELERQMTAERVTAVMLSRANNGQWNGGRIPYGYDWDPEAKTFSVNEKEAEIYRLICDLYEERQSLLTVCKILNGKGLKTKTGSAWSPAGVRKILTNVFYLGTYRYNVRPGGNSTADKNDPSEWIDVENHHPALIDDVRFNRLSFLLSRNVRHGRRKGDSITIKATHIFAGLIVCGNCGANMTATQDRRRADGWRPSIYGCASRRKKTKECTNKFIGDPSIAPFVFCAISSVLKAKESRTPVSAASLEKAMLRSSDMQGVTHIDGLEGFVEYIREGTPDIDYTLKLFSMQDTPDNEASMLKGRKNRLDTALRRLHSLYMYSDEAMSEKDYLIEKKQIMDELETIEKRLAELGAMDAVSDEEFLDKASYFIMVDKLIDYHPGDAEKLIRSLEPSVPKSFMRQTVSQITVTSGRIAEISFKNGLSMRFIYE